MDLKKAVLGLTPRYLHEALADLLVRRRRKLRTEFNRIEKLGRYVPGSSLINDKEVLFPDGLSYISMYDEIFNKEIYKFETSEPTPRIIDCGANIGLSSIYFATRFPNATVIAFEPDPLICSFLKQNIDNHDLGNVEIKDMAVWINENIISFKSEGADAGRLAPKEGAVSNISVQATRLLKYLAIPTEFLKIDIEGAEYKVLEDCKNDLGLVKKLFVEYHSHVYEVQELDALLTIVRNAGFRYHIHPVGVHSPQPFLSRREHLNMDLQLNIFAWRD